jgi:flagellar motility protein MotE (MotC chaperone)
MRWLLGAALLLCTGSLWAQSLGDVAREQRQNDNQPKAMHIYTNADLTVPGEGPVIPQEKGSKDKPSSNAPSKKQAESIHQMRVAELYQRSQQLESDMRDIQQQIATLSRSFIYGDPNRAEKNREMKQLADGLEEKRKELAGVRNELIEENERAHASSVLK